MTLKHIHDMNMVQPIRLPSFRRLFVGEGIAVFADQMLLVALTLLALRAGGPGFALGSVLAVAAIPGALLMPLGGWVSDRFSPAEVLLLCGVGRTLLASALASIVFLEISSLWPLYALAVALGVLNALYYPASLSTVPAILKDKALLGAGHALVMGTQQVSEMAGPVLAASIVALFSLEAVFGVNALMFAAATILFGLVASGTRHTVQRALGDEAASGELPDKSDTNSQTRKDPWRRPRHRWRGSWRVSGMRGVIRCSARCCSRSRCLAFLRVDRCAWVAPCWRKRASGARRPSGFSCRRSALAR